MLIQYVPLNSSCIFSEVCMYILVLCRISFSPLPVTLGGSKTNMDKVWQNEGVMTP